MALTISVIVCAHNEARYISACLHSLLAQSRPPDEILVINNASTDATRAVAEQVPRLRVVDEPRKGLVIARDTGRRESTGEILVYLDADCRAPLFWLERIERRFRRQPALVGLSGPYRYDDWDWWGKALIRAYDFTVAPATQLPVKYVLGVGTIFYGGNFAVRREALDAIGGFDTSIEFHGEDTNLGRRPPERRRSQSCRRSGARAGSASPATHTIGRRAGSRSVPVISGTIGRGSHRSSTSGRRPTATISSPSRA